MEVRKRLNTEQMEFLGDEYKDGPLALGMHKEEAFMTL